MVKVGIIGMGFIGQQHFQTWADVEGAQVVAVADKQVEKVAAAAAAVGGNVGEAAALDLSGVQRFTDADEMLKAGGFDVVDICLPTTVHALMTKKACQAGFHAICEKPMALSIEECDEMIAAAQESGRRLLCALCMRRFPAHIKAKKLLDEGAVGKPLMGMVTVIGNEFARMNDPENWKGDWEKAGGGAMFDTGYHAVYMLQHFFGPTKAVTMTGTRLLVEAENKADDTSVVALEMESGVLCSIVVTYVAIGDRWSEERRLLGTEGSLLIRDDPEDELPLLLLQGGDYRPIRVRNAPGVARFAIRELVSEFVDCLLTGGETDVTLAESRAAVATCCAAYESWRTGRRVEIAG